MTEQAGYTSILLFGIHMTARIVGFLGLVYFARELTQAELAVYFLFFLVVQVSSLISQLGLGSAIIQRIGSTDRTDQMYSAAILVVISVGMIITILIFIFRSSVSSYIGADIPLLLSLAVAGWLLADIHIRSLQAEDRVLTGGLMQLAQDVIRVGVGAFLVSIGLGAIGIIYGVIVGFATTAVLGAVLTDLRPVVPAWDDFTSLFLISKYTAFFGPTNFVYFWFDTAMIGIFLMPVNVTTYEYAWQTVRVLIIPTTAIRQTIFPKISQLAGNNTYDEIERIITGAVIFTLFIPIPGIIGIVVLGESILSIIYTPEYAVAALSMAILAVYMTFESLHRVGQAVATGIDRADVPFRSRMVGVTLAVVLNILLIPSFGIEGAAAATVLAKFADAAGLWYFICGRLDIYLPFRSLIWEGTSALIMGVTVYGVGLAVTIDTLPVLFATVGLGSMAYGCLVLLDPDIRQAIDQYVPVSLGS